MGLLSVTTQPATMNFLLPLGLDLFYAFLAIIALFLAVYLLRNLIWLLRFPFLLLNWILWISYNPLRDHWKHPDQLTPNLAFRLLVLSGIGPAWWILMHIATTPIRLINAVYFNLVLYWTVILCDSVEELFHPQRRGLRDKRGFAYLKMWFKGFPFRFLQIFARNGLALLEGIMMTGVDTVFPTYTMYHGTAFRGIATNIAQEGRWYVGGGDYAGSGIYFGFYKKTAEHYTKDDDHAIIVARVTLFPCRNSATFRHRMRRMIGNDGIGITHELGFPWRAIEHWRDHSYAQWFEYCLIQPNKAGQYVRTWRARPIAVLKNNVPSRIWGGLSLWTSGAGGVGAIVFSWMVIVTVGYLIIRYNP